MGGIWNGNGIIIISGSGGIWFQCVHVTYLAITLLARIASVGCNLKRCWHRWRKEAAMLVFLDSLLHKTSLHSQFLPRLTHILQLLAYSTSNTVNFISQNHSLIPRPYYNNPSSQYCTQISWKWPGDKASKLTFVLLEYHGCPNDVLVLPFENIVVDLKQRLLTVNTLYAGWKEDTLPLSLSLSLSLSLYPLSPLSLSAFPLHNPPLYSTH